MSEKPLKEMLCQHWDFDPSSGLESFYIYLFFSSGEKGDGCLSVTYHSLVCVFEVQGVSTVPQQGNSELVPPCRFPRPVSQV